MYTNVPLHAPRPSVVGTAITRPHFVLFVTFRNGSKMTSLVTNSSFGLKNGRFDPLSATRYPSVFYKKIDGR